MRSVFGLTSQVGSYQQTNGLMLMEQLRNFSDSRLVQGCLYCGGVAQARGHVPSRILLSKPYPDNLPVMPACESCNRFYSLDEEYVEWGDYDSVSITDQFGEVGCRNIQRMYVIEVKLYSPLGGEKVVPLLVNDWVEVQNDVYRYHTLQ